MYYARGLSTAVSKSISFKGIELEDKKIFDTYISLNKHENSEFNFTNFFIWRHSDQLKYTVIDDHLCILGLYQYKIPIIFPPLGDYKYGFDTALLKVIEYCKKNGLPIIIKSINEQIKSVMEEALPGMFHFIPDRDNYDYVYLSKDLIHLKGRKFQKKRNHINKFKSLYNYSYEPISGSNIEECIVAEMEWVASRKKSIGVYEEKSAVIEALRNFDALNIVGGALRVEGKIEAFSVGELLNPDMAVIHIEKANIEYSGIYAMINQQFAAHCWNDVTYINREEDMGLPGLRKAKLSYNPVKMIKKYTGLPAKSD